MRQADSNLFSPVQVDTYLCHLPSHVAKYRLSDLKPATARNRETVRGFFVLDCQSAKVPGLVDRRAARPSEPVEFNLSDAGFPKIAWRRPPRVAQRVQDSLLPSRKGPALKTPADRGPHVESPGRHASRRNSPGGPENSACNNAMVGWFASVHAPGGTKEPLEEGLSGVGRRLARQAHFPREDEHGSQGPCTEEPFTRTTWAQVRFGPINTGRYSAAKPANASTHSVPDRCNNQDCPGSTPARRRVRTEPATAR